MVNFQISFRAPAGSPSSDRAAALRNPPGKPQRSLVISIEARDAEKIMSGESVPLALPIARLATDTSEATILYHELRKPLLRYLVCLGLTADDAQDVVQDAFVSLHRHLSAGGSQENIRSWLFRVTHNADRNRQNSYQQRFSAPLDAEVEAVIDGATPEQAMLEKERCWQLHNAVRLRTPIERESLLLRAGGLRYREIGEVLGMATSTVGDTVERAIKKLAEKCNV